MTATDFLAIVCNISGGARQPVRIRQLVSRGLTHGEVAVAAALLDADKLVVVDGNTITVTEKGWRAEFGRRGRD